MHKIGLAVLDHGQLVLDGITCRLWMAVIGRSREQPTTSGWQYWV
jgi:hypothetical protein